MVLHITYTLPFILPFTIPYMLHRILNRCLRKHASHQSLLPLACIYATATSHHSTSHILHSVNEHQQPQSLESRSALFCWCHSAWIMAPKSSTGKVDLLSFRQTSQELERAHEMLASSDVKVKASKVSAMLQFAKGNPGDTANRIMPVTRRRTS